MRQSDPTSAARLRKGEGEEEVIRGGGVTTVTEEGAVEVSGTGSESKGGPLSTHSVGGMSKKSQGSDEDPLTQLDTEDADGFAFSAGYGEQVSA